MRSAHLAALALAAIACSGCSGGAKTAVTESPGVHTADDVQAALSDAGVELLQRVRSGDLKPAELEKAETAHEFTLLIGGVDDPTGQVDTRFTVHAYVFDSVDAAIEAERGQRENPDDFDALHTRFDNVFVAVWDLNLTEAPKKLPQQVLEAISDLRAT